MRRLRTAILCALGVPLALGAQAPEALAHGKEARITVASLASDPQHPLARLYRAYVVYTSDLEPIEGVDVELKATRAEGGSGVGPVRLTAVKDRPGVYVGEVTYPRFGNWTVTLTSFEPGEGQSEFVDRVLPSGGSAENARPSAQEERVYRLQLSFRFDGRDVRNIVVSVVHSLAGIAYFGLATAVLVLAWLGGRPLARQSALSRLRRVYLPAALVSLGALLASGLYNAYYDAPINPPGIFDLDRMGQIPNGQAYLGAFFVKPALLVVLAALAVLTHRALRRIPWPPVVSGGAGPEDASPQAPPAAASDPLVLLRRLALAAAGAGLLLAADIALLIYLHSISHLGIYLPST